ncbi:MAG: type II toxin-antitoxin system RelE/ParE family toxin [Reichenbachiella sp.]|uniref:type II toxin-antitoxin system RelE/ParE family toxin n=1 Tax=Reichenbachiella sp. TaxID=2184521 RepID=UPI002966067C|nr:type II toxin-antitoxin system RelE/ParE family toxin [Reichenbachiella sp.]MDW3208250.1 type II toxin-antitoxin system RelE/ParE family toxin [Reichenbachiella sp.]
MKRTLYFTDRALEDIQEIYDYSVTEWGERTALKYLQGFEEIFSLLRENIGLLKKNDKISFRFKVYPVQKHFLICDILDDTIYILSVLHTSLNLWDRLKDLEPALNEEVLTLMKKINRQP